MKIQNLNASDVNVPINNEEILKLNQKLEAEVHNRTELLNVLNESMGQLLSSETKAFDATLLSCMGRIGKIMDVDRVYIWKNHMEGMELYCTQTHEWSGGADAQQGNELTVSVPFPSDWYPKLSKNSCVNGIVSTFPGYEREHLQAQNILSIIVVPVFLQGEFWGFVGFDDCHSERLFTELEESILRTISLLFANSLLRNDMTIQLVKATEDALAGSRAKTDFLSSMSHEIRTPINAITGMVNIAKKAESREENLRCLDKIDIASKQLLSTINDILDMSKIEAGKIELAQESFDLPSLLYSIRSIIGMQAESENLNFRTEFDDNLSEILIGDDIRLTQLLLNLLSNAVKFTPEGGDILFSARTLRSHWDGYDELEFVIKDTGIGISPTQQETLFKKFVQADQSISRKYGGTGLGLTIAKNLIELMNGTLTLVSSPNEGSTFTVHISLKRGVKEQPNCPNTSDEEEENIDFSSYWALLVEDIEINQEIAVALLSETGLQIEVAGDGQQALELYHASPDKYDIIFMDIHMPEKDGYSATREIRMAQHANARSIPIVAMTANAFDEDIKKCQEAGMNDHIAKPIDPTELLNKTSKYLLQR